MSTSCRASLIAFAVLLPLAPGAFADVYKVVTPDGRVMYTDHPPLQPGMRTTVVSRPAASAPVVMPPPLSTLLAAPERAPMASAASGVPAKVSRELLDSLSAALGRREAVDTFRSTCLRAEPASASSFEKAAQD